MTLTERAVEKLRDAILTGEFAASHSLTERQVSEYLAMSRTPVRAALQTLANEGLLRYETQRGYQIREINLENILGAHKVRASLEALACQEVAETGLPAKTEKILEACVIEGQTLLEQSAGQFQHAQWRDMNDRFHQSIIDAAKNETLSNLMAHVALIPMLSFKVIATIGAKPNMALLEGSQRDHEQILASLKARQSLRASSRMQEHILFAGDLISDNIRKQYDSVMTTNQDLITLDAT